MSKHSGQPSRAKRHAKPLAERIDDAVAAAGGRITFHDLARALYPDPASHRYQANGGPPGCYMALSAGLRRAGFFVGDWPDRVVRARSR